jgi:hypothetical protein
VLYQSDIAADGRICTGSTSWTDYTYTAKVKITSIGTGGTGAGLMLRMQDTNNFYFFQLRQPDNQLRLYKFVSGTASQLGSSASKTLSLNTWYNVKVVVSGSNIKCYVDDMGTAAIDYADGSSPYTSGSIGFRAYKSAGKADDINVSN